MSIYRRCSSTDRDIRRIEERVRYIFNPGKTKSEFCHTLGVAKDSVFSDMVLIKQLYCQTGGRQYLHWILSFDKNVSHQVADVVGQEVLMLLKGEYQAIMATHINTANPHNHYLINPINLMTGRKFSESIKDMLIFREKINDILNRHGLKKIGLSDTFCEEDSDDGLPLSERSDLSELNHLKNIGQGTFMLLSFKLEAPVSFSLFYPDLAA